ncbi:TM2 domain-containing protein [Lacinutrix sp. Bg11-31]|uniref:TM2 domain-containing protein n=1 Tax=Lacinutrix sp. Bg11-31 TaxID=2057808 RepID=UPI000C301CBD|nr:TM2 domain-containing protein [Lacinutrix sp. Bg11-31]AUC81659.1 TM2 domain-containing protein [Lacinutrix sp. Bg11-31]
MKTKLFLTLLVFFVALTSSYASFPVERTVKTETTTSNSDTMDVSDVNQVLFTSPAVAGSDDKWIGVALWAFLWPFAAHRWFHGSPIGWNILFIITFGGLGIWAIVDLINMLTDNFY